MSNFRIGEKVICVDDRIGFTSKSKTLIKGEFYTISGFEGSDVYVEEVPYVIFNGKKLVPYYGAYRFRKLDHQFAEDLCKELSQQVKEEQLILS